VTDLALEFNADTGEINLAYKADGSGLKMDAGLESAVLISLHTDMRVGEGEIPDGETSQRGWWGDEFLENQGDTIGSRLWTFERGKLNTQIAQAIGVRASQSLQWLIEDGVASDVSVQSSRDEQCVKLDIKITRPNKLSDRFTYYWDGQALKGN
jgi:phage gp46-like protein